MEINITPKQHVSKEVVTSNQEGEIPPLNSAEKDVLPVLSLLVEPRWRGGEQKAAFQFTPKGFIKV